MKLGKLTSADRPSVVIAHVLRTTNPWERLRGLLARPPLAHAHAPLLDPCASVHTFFMRYPIDVVYLDRDFVATKLVLALKPWRMSAARGSSMTLELAAGSALKLGLQVEQALLWQTHSH